MTPAHADIDAALLRSRVRLHRSGPLTTASTSACIGVLLAGVLWDHAPQPRLLAWLGLLAVAIAARMAVGWAQRRSTAGRTLAPAEAAVWLRRHRLAILGHGMAWALAVPLLGPVLPAAQQLPLVYALTGLAAGALVISSFDLPGALLFAVPGWLALLLHRLLLAPPGQRTLGSAALLLLLLCTFTGLRTQRAARRAAVLELAEAGREAQARELQARADSARQQLADQHQLLAQLLQTTPHGFWFIDQQGLCTQANPAMCALLQLQPAEIVGRRIQSFFDDTDLATLEHQMALRATGAQAPYEIGLRRADGTRLICLVHATLLVDSNGQPVGAAGIWTDITEQQQQLQRLRDNGQALTAARDDAERANRAKSQFLSQMSHELRTPLNAISGFAQLLQSDQRHPLLPQQAAYVREVLRGADHLLELINEVLDLGRIETGRLHISTAPVQLLPLLDECLALVRALALSHGVQLHALQLAQPAQPAQPAQLADTADTADGSAAIPTVLADRTRLKQVLLNLLGNAIKYNRPGGDVQLECNATDDGRVRIAVRDSGRGLTREDQLRLFQPFERLSATGSAIQGTGIGLALSRRLVEAMDGEIDASSTPGVGSTFWLLLPVVPQLPAAHAVQDSARGSYDVVQQGAPPPSASAQPPRHTVLYIEDNAVNLVLMEAMLQRLPDVRLVTADLPEPGLELAQRELPALVLLDIQLPGMDGFEVLAELRRVPATRDIPVVAVSANALPADIQSALAAGFTDYLTKPLQLDRLLDTVRKLLPAPPSPPAAEPDAAAAPVPTLIH